MKKFSDLIEKSVTGQESCHCQDGSEGIIKSRFRIAKSDDDKIYP